VTARDQLTWRLCEVYVQAAPSETSPAGTAKDLQRKERLFIELQSDPPPTFAQIIAPLPLAPEDPAAVDRLSEAIKAVTAKIDGDGRAAKPD
jgi:hypothetical protein